MFNGAKNTPIISPYAGALAARPLHPSGTMNPRSPNGISPFPGMVCSVQKRPGPTNGTNVIPPLIDMAIDISACLKLGYINPEILLFYAIEIYSFNWGIG